MSRMSFAHIKKLNELMGAYTSELNATEMHKRNMELEKDESVRGALEVLIQHHLKKARNAYMSVQEEIHSYLYAVEEIKEVKSE